jgi:hypothetical protein
MESVSQYGFIYQGRWFLIVQNGAMSRESSEKHWCRDDIFYVINLSSHLLMENRTAVTRVTFIGKYSNQIPAREFLFFKCVFRSFPLFYLDNPVENPEIGHDSHFPSPYVL